MSKKIKLCASRCADGLASWSAPHRCKLPQGHEGKHRCKHEIDMKNGKVLLKPISCRKRWGKP